jgi:hypothetical protein
LVVGGVITNRVNVRLRSRNCVADMFSEAIAAVSAAEASIDFMASVSRPAHMSESDFAVFSAWLVGEGLRNWSNRLSDANLAVARVLPYRPQLESYLPFSPDASYRGTWSPSCCGGRSGGVRTRPPRPSPLLCPAK